MKHTDNEKQNNSNPLAAVATGVVIGAGVAAAGAAILHDKKNREKVTKVVKDVTKQMSGYLEDMQKKANEKTEEGKQSVIQGNEVVKTKAKESLDSAQDSLEAAKKNL